MTITPIPRTPIRNASLVIKLNSGFEISIHGDNEYLTIDTPDKEGQCFDFSLSPEGIKCDGILLRKVIDSQAIN